MIEIKIVKNWDDFKECLFRLSNMGFYVRWTASQYSGGRKGIYLIDLGSDSVNDSAFDILTGYGFTDIMVDPIKTGILIHAVSPSLHD